MDQESRAQRKLCLRGSARLDRLKKKIFDQKKKIMIIKFVATSKGSGTVCLDLLLSISSQACSNGTDQCKGGRKLGPSLCLRSPIAY